MAVSTPKSTDGNSRTSNTFTNESEHESPVTVSVTSYVPASDTVNVGDCAVDVPSGKSQAKLRFDPMLLFVTETCSPTQTVSSVKLY